MSYRLDRLTAFTTTARRRFDGTKPTELRFHALLTQGDSRVIFHRERFGRLKENLAYGQCSPQAEWAPQRFHWCLPRAAESPLACDAGWSSLVACRAHNPKVADINPVGRY